MTKFNQFEALLIREGLKKVKEEMIAEIEKTEKDGKTPIMTTGFVMMTLEELTKKVEGMTKKVEGMTKKEK